MEWQGMDGILLTEYLKNKKRLAEKKMKLKLNQLNHFVLEDDKNGNERIKQLEKEVREIEEKIIGFISPLDREQLKSLLYLSLDMDVDVGCSDKLL